jgi:thiamine-phosphate pyrophosphorylase
MKLIVITTEHFFEGEAAALNALFERGMEILHLRKPASTETGLKNLIEQIDEQFHKRIVLHDHYSLINAFRLKGIHLNSRNLQKSTHTSCPASRSCHSIKELENVSGYNYVFLSPVFDSISKTGYTHAFTSEDLLSAGSVGLINKQVIALGGINSENIPTAHEYGFGGIAVIGALWKNFSDDKDENALFERFDRLQITCKKNGLQNGGLLFITHQTEHYTYLQSVEIALKGGCRMIQLRMKEASLQETEQTGILAKALCQQYGADLYIDDHVEICKRIGATGVHLGKTDMLPDEARKILGENFIIGGTANTFEDIQRLKVEGVDYIGLGPFRFTTTKKNLSPVIGLSGYKQIVEQCINQGINLPIFAIGGITANDIPGILNTGITGIAMSSAVLQAENPGEETKKILFVIGRSSGKNHKIPKNNVKRT